VSLSARNIPGSDAVRGIRTVETEFAADTWDTYAARLTEIAEGVRSQGALMGAIEDAVASLQAELLPVALTYMTDAYEAGAKAVVIDFDMGDADQALLDEIVSDPNGIAQALDAFAKEQSDTLTALALASFEDRAFDRDVWDEGLEEALESGASKFDLVARTESTRASNVARARQYEILGLSDELYAWVTAEDDRVCEICDGLRADGPYTLHQLEARTQGFLAHPFDRCTLVLVET